MVKYSFLSEFAIQVLHQHHFAEVSLKVFDSIEFRLKCPPETLFETAGTFDMLQAGMQCSFS